MHYLKFFTRVLSFSLMLAHVSGFAAENPTSSSSEEGSVTVLLRLSLRDQRYVWEIVEPWGVLEIGTLKKGVIVEESTRPTSSCPRLFPVRLNLSQPNQSSSSTSPSVWEDEEGVPRFCKIRAISPPSGVIWDIVKSSGVEVLETEESEKPTPPPASQQSGAGVSSSSSSSSNSQ